MSVAKMKNVEVGQLDLASPNSIDRFANEFLNSNRALDLLINNAGIMATPPMRGNRPGDQELAHVAKWSRYGTTATPHADPSRSPSHNPQKTQLAKQFAESCC
jgi:NAD(P)-dependent dehydrogenase (short-subunit alcohol dehydrogenase family)